MCNTNKCEKCVILTSVKMCNSNLICQCEVLPTRYEVFSILDGKKGGAHFFELDYELLLS